MLDELDEQADLAVRLRVAMSLCPEDALTHRRSDPISRVDKIARFLAAEELIAEEYVVRLAQAVDRALDAWQIGRETVAGFRTHLLERDGSLCQCCGADLGLDPYQLTSVLQRDPYKLGWVNPPRQYQATVDHREPVSKFGTNQLDNLWLLCRYCNEGKGDGGPLLLKHELDYAAALPWTSDEDPPPGLVTFAGRLAYRVFRRSNFSCGTCGRRGVELTIRRRRPRGLSVLSNLAAVCLDCAH